MTNKTPFVNHALLVANIGIFIWMVFQGVNLMMPTPQDLLAYGANNWQTTMQQEEYWRLFTCTFIHVGVIHLLFNMQALRVGGELAEQFFGHILYLLIYLMSGIFASLTSLAWNPGNVVSAGASGAIFGIIGAQLGFVIRRIRELNWGAASSLLMSYLMFIGVSLFFGFSVAGIDNAAHLGGLCMGLLLGLVLAPKPANSKRVGSAAVLIMKVVFACILFLLLTLGLSSVAPRQLTPIVSLYSP